MFQLIDNTQTIFKSFSFDAVFHEYLSLLKQRILFAKLNNASITNFDIENFFIIEQSSSKRFLLIKQKIYIDHNFSCNLNLPISNVTLSLMKEIKDLVTNTIITQSPSKNIDSKTQLIDECKSLPPNKKSNTRPSQKAFKFYPEKHDTESDDLSIDPNMSKEELLLQMKKLELEQGLIVDSISSIETDKGDLESRIEKLHDKQSSIKYETNQIKEWNDANLRIFLYDKNLYFTFFKLKNRDSIPQLFLSKYPIFSFMDENNLFDDNEYNTFMELFLTLTDEKTFMDPKFKRHDFEYLPSNTIELIEEFIVANTSYYSSIMVEEQFVSQNANSKN